MAASKKIAETRLSSWLTTGARASFGSRLMIQRVENLVSSGTPDVEGLLHGGQQFWCELKVTSRPAREDTLVDVHFQDKQAKWLAKRWAFNRSAWLLLQVGAGRSGEKFLFAGSLAPAVEIGMVMQDLRRHSLLHGSSLTPEKIIRCMTGCTSI